jgi:uncharacterized protein YkwD
LLGVSVFAALISLVANHVNGDDAARVSQVASADRPAVDPEPVAPSKPMAQADAARTASRLVAAAIGALDEPPPSMREILLAADALVKAGVIEPPPPEPTLAEVIQSVDVLIKSGAMEAPEPPLSEVLRAVDVMIREGAMPATDEWRNEVLVAVAQLEQARAPQPPPPPPAPTSTPQPRAAAPAPPPPPPPPPAPAPRPANTGDGWYDAAFEQQVFNGVNARRAQAGLAPLTFESRLARASAGYAQTLAVHRHFSHTGPDGSTLVDRVTATGFPFNVQIGEVIAWGTQNWPATGVVQAWMDSPAHRDQILEPVYRRAGIGCYFTNEAGILNVRCVMDLAG